MGWWLCVRIWLWGVALKETDTKAMYAFIDSHCAAHPLDSIAAAAQALVEEFNHQTPLMRSGSSCPDVMVREWSNGGELAPRC